MIGWLGDFFRFWWALCYWNSRKTWFRLRGAHRDNCPCQTFSDSGLALDSRCEAVVHWDQAKRFRRVCPLLTETPDGWRCGVDAERVRPFWLRAFFFLGAAGLILYFAAALSVFTALRLAHYDLDFPTVAWPLRWPEIRQAQEKLYANRAQRAMNAGHFNEAMLALDRVYQLNPRNYQAALALANLTQVASQTSVSDLIYERLLSDVPAQRITTAQLWFRPLLARGAYGKIKPLAVTMLTEDVSERNAWLNALLFSARATGDSDILTAALGHGATLPEWCTDLIETERALLSGQLAKALPRLQRIHRQTDVPYRPYYQIDRLIRHAQTAAALETLQQYGTSLPREEAAFLRLRLYDLSGWTHLLPAEKESLLQIRLTAPFAARFCAYLLAHPDPALATGYAARFAQQFPEPTPDTLPLFHATYLAAIAAGNPSLAEKTLGQIRRFTHSDARVIIGLGQLLMERSTDGRLARILPLVPLPIEMVYAILERKPVPASTP